MKVLLVILLSFLVAFSTDQCYDENECSDSTLDDSEIECDGYFACESSSITTTDYLDCDGDNGCTYSSIIAENGADINAYGYLGAFRAHIINEEGQTVCNGAYGCYLADIIGSYLTTCGYYSAYQSSFTADSSTSSTFYYYNYGYNSAAYSDVVVTSDNTLNMYYYGYYSGYRNYIDCFTGSTCVLNCLGLGCQNTELFCYSGATCSYDCSNADVCPTEYVIDSTIGSATTTAKLSADTSSLTQIGTNERRRMVHLNDEELKRVRKERHIFRETQRPIDEAKWAKKDARFAEFLKKRSEKKKSKKIISDVKDIINKADNAVVKDLTSRHILYGVVASSVIYFIVTLLWYFIYYKPRKNDLYSIV